MIDLDEEIEFTRFDKIILQILLFRAFIDAVTNIISWFK